MKSEQGWVAIQNINSFDPIFDLVTQWKSKKIAKEEGKDYLQSKHDKPIHSFWIGQVCYESLIGTSHSIVISLKNIEKVTNKSIGKRGSPNENFIKQTPHYKQ